MSLRKACAPWVVLMMLGSCGKLVKPPKIVEQKNEKIVGTKFKTVAVIGGDDMQTTIRMSVQVREQMTQAGVNAVRRAGRWSSQFEALTAICEMPGEDAVDGVVFVTYDRLALHDCATKGVAYAITGGGKIGLSEMTERMLRFLKS